MQVLAPALAVLLVSVMFGGCASDSLGGEGDDCFRATDCEEGLVCVEQACSRDLDGLVSNVDGPAMDAGAATGGASAGGAPPASGGTGGGAGAATGGTGGSGASGGTDTTGGTGGGAGAGP